MTVFPPVSVADARAMVATAHGDVAVRLAETADDILAAQALRYRVFYEEKQAKPSVAIAAAKRDFDHFDEVCDHLLVTDKSSGQEHVVGTYRLLRKSVALQQHGFYSAQEFDITPLLASRYEMMELGRSCVDARYRTGSIMQLLWRGIAGYAFAYNIDLMFGCASFSGTDIAQLQLPLAYLQHFCLADVAMRPKALPHLYHSLDTMPVDQVDTKAAIQALPPLLKGYLRLGGKIGDGAVIDWEFNTTDVCIVVHTDLITGKYYKHYKRLVPAGDEAAVYPDERG